MISKYRLRWLMGLPIRLFFQNRAITIKGEAGVDLQFRPSETPRLLGGIKRLDPAALSHWSTLLQPGDSIIDIGAHIGITVQRFHAILGGDCNIWAFEPNPRNFELLEHNVRELGPRVSIFPYAIGDEDGTVAFADNVRHGAISQLERVGKLRRNTGYWDVTRNIEVLMRRLDSLLEEHPDFHPSFIKIDVEGAAALVMKGAQHLLHSFKPTVYCEYHHKHEIDAVRETLSAEGYRGVRFDQHQQPLWTDVASTPTYFVHPDRPMPSKLILTDDASEKLRASTTHGRRHATT